jgi:SAM-dependent methyltransferase
MKRKSPRSFDAVYAAPNPWEIGRPQGEIVRLAEAGEIRGRVLDCGCGTGENASYLAARGHDVVGIDTSVAAIEKARAKGGLGATFLVADALALRDAERPVEPFDTALDSGLFHGLSDAERVIYVGGLACALRAGGTFFLLCCSEHERFARGPVCGPRGVTQAEIRATFAGGWRVNYVREARIDATSDFPNGFLAWLASATRL